MTASTSCGPEWSSAVRLRSHWCFVQAVSANSGCYAAVRPLLRSAAQTTTGCLAIARRALFVSFALRVGSSSSSRQRGVAVNCECRQSVDGGLSGRWPCRQAGRAAAAAAAARQRSRQANTNRHAGFSSHLFWFRSSVDAKRAR